jgi:hypothetical protein
MICCLYSAGTNALIGLGVDAIDPQPGQAVIWRDRAMPDFSLEAWNPAVLDFFMLPTVPMTKLAFLRRFTDTEYAAIKAATATNPAIDFFWQKFLMAQDIKIGDAELVAGIRALESAGLIAAGRAAEILGE